MRTDSEALKGNLAHDAEVCNYFFRIELLQRFYKRSSEIILSVEVATALNFFNFICDSVFKRNYSSEWSSPYRTEAVGNFPFHIIYI